MRNSSSFVASSSSLRIEQNINGRCQDVGARLPRYDRLALRTRGLESGRRVRNVVDDDNYDGDDVADV